jgi:hypothetical protein
MLLRHQVNIYALQKDYSADGKTFKAGKAFVIPTEQTQFKIIKTAFEKTLTYKDSLFYDVTAWTLSLAFGLPNAELKSTAGLQGEKVTGFQPFALNTHHLNHAVAYAFRWNEYNAPQLLYRLQSKGILAKVATQAFRMNINGKEEAFGFGTIVVPEGLQKQKGEVLANLIDDAAGNTGVEVFALPTGYASGGVDLGSASFVNVKTPKVMLMGGAGTDAVDVGEIWHLLDTRFQIPVSIVEADRFNAINPSRYNVIIMPSGTYNSLDKNAQEKLRTWVSAGGTLVAQDAATKFLANNGFTKVLFRPSEDKKDTTVQYPYYLRNDEVRAKEMAGSLFEAALDLTHPLCYGYRDSTVSIFKSNTLFMDQNNEPYDSPVMFTSNPLQSGYLYRGYRNQVKNAAAVNIDNLGRGKVISIGDDLNFRAFWLGTSKLFLNSLFFGDIVRF